MQIFKNKPEITVFMFEKQLVQYSESRFYFRPLKKGNLSVCSLDAGNNTLIMGKTVFKVTVNYESKFIRNYNNRNNKILIY